MPPTFLSIPREVRDEIYKFYVSTDGGYLFDTECYSTGKLKRADGRATNLDLQYTCKQVSREMEGVALRENTITFTTIHSPELSLLAARFSDQVKYLDEIRQTLFEFSGHTLTDAIYTELCETFPHFAGVLDRLRAEGDPSDLPESYRPGSYGKAPSVYRDFYETALQAIFYRCPGGAEAMDRYWAVEETRRWGDDPEPDVLHRNISPALAISCPVRHWFIPSEDDLTSLTTLLGDNSSVADDITDGYDLSRYRFSAAASAIRFLEFMPATSRAHLRSIVLDEDREAVAIPQDHAIGLVPFCVENPLLRIERRVALWRNVLQPCPNSFDPQATPHNRVQFGEPWRLASAQVTKNVSGWVAEALALEDAGMPTASFTLVLDAEPAPQLAAEVFQRIVRRDAAWQSAWEEYHKRREGGGEGLLPWPVRRSEIEVNQTGQSYSGYFFEDFPRALQDVAAGSSVVRCNFDVGEEWSVAEVSYAQSAWTPAEWTDGWYAHDPPTWEMVAPLPSWKALMQETVFPGRLRRRPRPGDEFFPPDVRELLGMD